MLFGRDSLDGRLDEFFGSLFVGFRVLSLGKLLGLSFLTGIS